MKMKSHYFLEILLNDIIIDRLEYSTIEESKNGLEIYKHFFGKDGFRYRISVEFYNILLEGEF